MNRKQGKDAILICLPILAIISMVIISPADKVNFSDSNPFLLVGVAFAQQDIGGGGGNSPDFGTSPDAGTYPGDNTTDPGVFPADNSTDFGATQANSTDLTTALGGNTTDVLAAAQSNTTLPEAIGGGNATGANPAVPEFGPIALLVLVISILSTVIISLKTRIRFVR